MRPTRVVHAPVINHNNNKQAIFVLQIQYRPNKTHKKQFQIYILPHNNYLHFTYNLIRFADIVHFLKKNTNNTLKRALKKYQSLTKQKSTRIETYQIKNENKSRQLYNYGGYMMSQINYKSKQLESR